MPIPNKFLRRAFSLPEYVRRVAGPKSALPFRNIEGNSEYDFELDRVSRKPGVSAMIRAKNEESKIGLCLESIYPIFDEIIIVNNNSDDGTDKIIQQYIEKRDSFQKIKYFNYPFNIARVGPDNVATNPDSLQSLVYYYNWCLSKCTLGHVFKWDADMVVPKQSASALRKQLSGLTPYWPAMLLVPLQTVYIAGEKLVYFSVGEVNQENMVFPNRSDVRFVKNDYFELLKTFCGVKYGSVNNVLIYEVKDTREDEFSHWSTLDFPTARKKREWENFNKVKSGKVDGAFRKMTNQEISDMFF